MLLIALALQSASMAATVTAAEVTRSRMVRTTLRRSARPQPVLSPLISSCEVERDCGMPSARARIAATREPLIDRKMEMLRAAEGPACNRTGMPVCPDSGRRVLRLSF
ncbi:hypothetical protein [Sphingomonas sp. R1]|uniref:hypothetical protein n=1 Tax=Sphingomonas sp. R1 TaxID=399176 RepID=UPI0022240EF7|nr:hypothetical protein [Sphingomonas sp. R1]UYY76484.1 hypothetical protein OIM94_13265 [Sphingomonas sp. R1]